MKNQKNLSKSKNEIFPTFSIITEHNQKIHFDLTIPFGENGTTANHQTLQLKRNRELLWTSLGFGSKFISSANTNQSHHYSNENTGINLNFTNKTDYHDNYAFLLTILLEVRTIGSILGAQNSRMIDHPSQRNHRDQLINLFEQRRSISQKILGYFDQRKFQINPITQLLIKNKIQQSPNRPQFFIHPSDVLKNIKREIAHQSNIAKTNLFNRPDQQINTEEIFIKKSNLNKAKILKKFSPTGKLPHKLFFLSAQSLSAFTPNQWNSLFWIRILNDLFKIKYRNSYLGYMASKSTFGELDQNETTLHSIFNKAPSNAIYIFKQSKEIEAELSAESDFSDAIIDYLHDLSRHKTSAKQAINTFKASNDKIHSHPLFYFNNTHLTSINLHSNSDQQTIHDLATSLTIERKLIHTLPQQSSFNTEDRQKPSSRWSFRIDIKN